MTDTTTSNSNAKIPLPIFLKMLTNNNVPAGKAMAVAAKIYNTHNTPTQLGLLSDYALESAGVSEKDVRKLVIAAVRKAGYKQKPSAGSSSDAASTSKSQSSTKVVSQPKSQKKRRRDDDMNELLPDRQSEEDHSYGSLDFNEVLDEEAIKPKFTVINRAPIMMAWAFIVAERLGFQREEALSIASVYTEMNAITKGVSLGIYTDGAQNGMEANRTGSQPYVELMGRRLLYQTASSQWRALASGSPVAPTSAFSYISRALRQTTPHVLGALRLLAASYPPGELNEKGFSLYAEFRPEADGWGQRGEVRCSTILGLRQRATEPGGADPAMPSPGGVVKVEQRPSDSLPDHSAEQPLGDDPAQKKLKLEPSERDEFDAALDDDTVLDGFDFNGIP